MSQDYPLPILRRLRVYAFDPQASTALSTAMINDYVIELPWEERWESPLMQGPVNDYIEVIDYDPAGGLFYAPVDLNDPVLLAQDGLAPSEGRPQFHQQMVFAVIMRTIRAFERALGRVVLWARDEAVSWNDPELTRVERNFTKRLRVYPHGLREKNAYYSPAKRALLFGYFRADSNAPNVSANWVFTCLSQDIVAHETAHAILHGLWQRSIEPSNADAMAFHEAFADIIALLQHFTMPNVVGQLLGQSGGSLREPGLLTGLGEQFGHATGRQGALRYALQILTDKAKAKPEDLTSTISGAAAMLAAATEAHERGGFLVAAVFDAFVTIYERRTADLFRLARPGMLAGNGLNPDLLARLAEEAARSASHMMSMCVRALDYAPPVDMRFGEYLRAIVTADTDLVPNDKLKYRIAVIEAFKRWGITVPGCISMAPDSLLWDPPQLDSYPQIVRAAEELVGKPLSSPADAFSVLFTVLLSRLRLGVGFYDDRLPSSESASLQGETDEGRAMYKLDNFRDWQDEEDSPAASLEDGDSKHGKRNLRDLSMEVVLFNQKAIHDWLNENTIGDEDWEKLLGLCLLPENRASLDFENKPLLRSLDCGEVAPSAEATPLFQVNSARIAKHTGPDGNELHMLIVHVTQKRRGYFDPGEQMAADAGNTADIGDYRWQHPDFWFQGGATLHVDLRDGRLLRIINKQITCNDRLNIERAFRCGETTGSPAVSSDRQEPFAFMHRCC